jgi:integrase
MELITDTMCRNAGPGRLSDGNGLYLLTSPEGHKGWRFDYRFKNTRKTISLGRYPRVTLGAARKAREVVRGQVARGLDPSQVRKDEREASKERTFRALGEKWFATLGGRAKKTNDRDRILLNHLYDMVGDRPINEIEAPEVYKGLGKLAEGGTVSTANRCRRVASQVFRFGIAIGRCKRDPAHDLRGAIPPATVTPRPALTNPEAVGKLMRDIAGYQGSFLTKLALQFLALTMVRPGECRAAEWLEFDLDKGIWTIPAAKMKMRRKHEVALSRQALAILAAAHEFTGEGQFVFARRKVMSDNTFNKALRTMGYDTVTEHCAHGFRSTASTILNEENEWNPDVIERVLAHGDGSVRGLYNRAEYVAQRAKLM